MGAPLSRRLTKAATRKFLKNIKKGVTTDRNGRSRRPVNQAGVIISRHVHSRPAVETQENHQQTLDFAKELTCSAPVQPQPRRIPARNFTTGPAQRLVRKEGKTIFWREGYRAAPLEYPG